MSERNLGTVRKDVEEGMARAESDVEEGVAPAAAAAAAAAGPNFVYDDSGPAPPGAVAESVADSALLANINKKERQYVEEIRDESAPAQMEMAANRGMKTGMPYIHDNVGPSARATGIGKNEMGGESSNVIANSGIVSPMELQPPVPFNTAAHDDVIERKIRGDEESVMLPPRDDVEELAAPTGITTSSTFVTRNGTASSASNRDDSPMTAVVNPERAGWGRHLASTMSQSVVQHIPEAFLVEENDEEVVIADPVLPWYKRKKAVCSLILIVAIVLGVTSGIVVVLTNRSVNTTFSPTVSAVPTTERTTSPSSSLAPSASPTECALTISTNKQVLDLPLDKPTDTKVLIEGRNAVVLTQETETRNVHIVFYQLTNGVWQRGNHFIEDESLARDTYADEYNSNVPSAFDETYDERISLAFNGKTAMVGFPLADIAGTNAGAVYVYERNPFGVWEKSDEPLLPQDDVGKDLPLFGYSVDLDGDLACVLVDARQRSQGILPKVYVFQNIDEEWVQIRRLDLPWPPFRDRCFISGDTLALKIHSRLMDIYQYDQDVGDYERIQRIDHRGSWDDETWDQLVQPDDFTSISFNQQHLTYSVGFYDYGYDDDDDVSLCYEPRGTFIYNRDRNNSSYVLQQVINSTSNGDCLPMTFSERDGDLLNFEAASHQSGDALAFAGINETHIYIQGSMGSWESALTLEESYRNYQVSGRHMITIGYDEASGKDEVYAFNLEPCELSPTQVPSSSAIPSLSKVPTPAPSVPATSSFTSTAGGTWRTMTPTGSVSRVFPTYTPTTSPWPTPVTWPPTTTSLPTPVTTPHPITPFPTEPPGKTAAQTSSPWPTPVTWPPHFTPFPTEPELPLPSLSTEPLSTNEPETSSSPIECTNTPGYVDIYGDGCELYEAGENAPAWCLAYGASGDEGKTPNENCCVCKRILAGG